MSEKRPARALHLVELRCGPVLYDTNRVRTYRCSDLEAALLRAAATGAESEGPAPTGEPDALQAARQRLERLTGLSESLAGAGGLAAGFSGHPCQLFLHVCNDCNLRCAYCYAGSCSLGMAHLFMSAETARAAVDYLFEGPPAERPYVLTFAGGEPLLNLPAIEAAVEHAHRRARRRRAELECRVYTNGTVMSERIYRFVSDNELFLQITLDGPPESHDRLRPGAGGRSTSKKILETIRFLERRGFRRFAVRSNLCRGNADPARIESFFRQAGLERYYLRPIMAEDGSPFRLDDAELGRISEHYERLADRALEAADDGEAPEVPAELARYVARLELGVKTKRYCGAGREMVVVSPEGDLYPCPAMVGDPRFRIGTLERGVAPGGNGRFRNRPVDDKPVCAACWARNLCGGGCALTAGRADGGEERPDPLDCSLIQARIRAAISLVHRRQDAGPGRGVGGAGGPRTNT